MHTESHAGMHCSHRTFFEAFLHNAGFSGFYIPLTRHNPLPVSDKRQPKEVRKVTTIPDMLR